MSRAPRVVLGRVVVLAALAAAVVGCSSDDPAADDGCPPPEGTEERTTTFDAPPPMCIDPDATYVAEVSTSAGDITIELDAAASPLAVNNFVFLARNHYYDGVEFHRVVPGFVVQGGDATGDPPGTGGPGYTFADELPDSADAYRPGTVAMANRGPDTNGSQFFIVLEGGSFDPLYSVLGQVTGGFDTTVSAIADSASPSGATPMTTVIDSVTVSGP